MVASKGGKKEYDELMTIYKKCDNDAQRKHVLHSIGYISDPKLKEAALDWTTSGAVKLQDFFYIFNSVGSSDKTGQTVVWNYFVANFDRIREMLAKANPSLMHAVIIYSSRHFVTRDRLEEVRAFFQSHPLKGTERVVAQMVESMGVTVAFAERAAQSDMAKDSFWASLGQ